MTPEILFPLSGASVILAFFGGIALLMWVDSRGKAREKELAHIERLKAIEAGQTLPDAEKARAEADAEWARAEASRARTAGVTATFVVLGVMGAAVGGSYLVFQLGNPGIHLPLACVIWGVSGLVSLVAVSTGLGMMYSPEHPDDREGKPRGESADHPNSNSVRSSDNPANIMQ